MNLQGNGVQTHTLTSRAENYGTLCRQRKAIATSMLQTLLGVVRAYEVRICKKGGSQVPCVKETAYDVDKAGLQLYTQQLRVNFEEAKEAELVPVWDEEYSGSSTEKDDRDVEQDPTRIANDYEREEGVGNCSSMCAQDGVNRGDCGEEGAVGAQEDNEEHPEDDKEGEDDDCA